jgi:hypothetical protein
MHHGAMEAHNGAVEAHHDALKEAHHGAVVSPWCCSLTMAAVTIDFPPQIPPSQKKDSSAATTNLLRSLKMTY